MATWKFTYWFEGSEWFEWRTEITDEEAAIINESIENGVLLDDVPELSDLLWRVYAEIRGSMEDEDEDEEYEETNEDDEEDFEYYDDYEDEDDCCEGLTVHFQDPNEPFYNIPHVPRDVIALLREKEEKERQLRGVTEEAQDIK